MKKTSGFEGYFFKYSSWSYWLINNLRKILKIKKKMIAHAHTEQKVLFFFVNFAFVPSVKSIYRD